MKSLQELEDKTRDEIFNLIKLIQIKLDELNKTIEKLK